MGHAEEKTNLYLSNLSINKKSKGNLFTEKPVFYDSGNSLIVSSGQSCHMYNVQTGNHVQELFQCADDIISCQLHPLNSYMVIAVTENGELTVFNVKTNEVEYSTKLTLNPKILKKQNVSKYTEDNEKGDENFDWESQPLNSLSQRKFLYAEVKIFHKSSSEVYVWASWCLNDELYAHVSAFSFHNGEQLKQMNLCKILLQKCYQNFAIGSLEMSEILTGMSTNALYIANFENKKFNSFSLRKHYIGHNIKLTCIAFHPTESCIATGDSLGRVIIWRNFFEKHPLKDIFHWHALPVHDIVFSKYGNYLFSGGEENVLVKWSLSSRNKEFLPRLSSTIYHLSVAPESSFLSVSTTDNRILVINFNFQNISTIQHFSRWSVLKSNNALGIFTIDPRTNSFVLNGKTGHIQFLSAKEDGKFMYTFDVTSRNFITSDSISTVENTEVTHAKFNKNGKWLVTAESRKGGLHIESRLKFWSYSEKDGSFSLNTSVELPHESTAVRDVQISSNDKVATSGPDKKFRLWSVVECHQVNKIKEMWAVENVCNYRNLHCIAIDFSKDSSLLSVSFGSVLTIWDTSSCALKCTLSVPLRKDDIKFCKFGNNELSHLIVTGTRFHVSCWNTITLSMTWTVPLKLSILISDPRSIYMAAFSMDNSVIIFNPGSPVPDFLSKNISDSPVRAGLCTTSENGKFCLYYLTSDQDLYCLEDVEKYGVAVSNDKSQCFFTPYSAQVAKIRNGIGLEKQTNTSSGKTNRRLVSSMIDSPAHTLPNPSLLCSDFLTGLLLFSNDRPSIGVTKENRKNENHVRSDQLQEAAPNEDLHRKEKKLSNIVKAIFV